MKISNVIKGTSFLRSFENYVNKHHNFREEFKTFFLEFAGDPSNPKFKLHNLKGGLKGYYSIKIKYDLRLIFGYENETIILYDIGTHDKVY